MSHSEILRFPHSAKHTDKDPEGAKHARLRIASIPDQYLAHATPSKEDLVGAVHPVSPAAAAKHTPKSAPHAAQQAHHEAQPATKPEVVAKRQEETVATPAVMASIATNPLEVAGAGAIGVSVPLPDDALPDDQPGPERQRRQLPRAVQPVLTGIGVFCLLLLLFKAPIFLSQLNFLTQPKTASTTQAASSVSAAPTISIPKINVNAPVVYAADNNENDILKDLESGVVHYAGTALPGQPGNSVIFGHSSNDWWEPGNYKFVFVLLDKLQPGDTFSVNYNSKQYIYQVTGSQVVLPTDVGVLAQTPDPEMTLITCTPPGTSWKRLVVTAKQISPAPAASATSKSGSSVNSPSTLPSNSPGITDKLSGWWHSLIGIFGFKSDSPPSESTDSGSSSTSGAPATLPATQ